MKTARRGTWHAASTDEPTIYTTKHYHPRPTTAIKQPPILYHPPPTSDKEVDEKDEDVAEAGALREHLVDVEIAKEATHERDVGVGRGLEANDERAQLHGEELREGEQRDGEDEDE